MAQQGSFGKPGIHQAMEGVDVVNSFANEAAFPKEILVSVGNSARVYIERRVRREDCGKTRLAGRLQVHARLWLQYGVTPFQLFAGAVEDGAIQGMRKGANQLSRRVPGKLRV